jgi:AcrR family transcriptional regulator
MTRSPVGRPAGTVRGETRTRIIAAAMCCVAEVGYSRTTIRQIAKAAGITSGSLYHYFSTKADLLTATLAEIEQTAMPRLRAAAGRGTDAVERLHAVFDESDRLRRDYPYLAAFERAMRAEGAAVSGMRDVLAEIIADEGAVDAIYALARGLTEQAANLPPDAYGRTLSAAKALTRGTLFD